MRGQKTPDWSEFFDGALGTAIWRLPVQELEFDERTLELRRGGVRIALEPMPLHILMALIRRPRQLLSAAQLAEAIWCGQVVSEAALSEALSALRTALGDRSHGLIQTVHGKGFRLAATPVRLLLSRTEIAD